MPLPKYSLTVFISILVLSAISVMACFTWFVYGATQQIVCSTNVSLGHTDCRESMIATYVAAIPGLWTLVIAFTLVNGLAQFFCAEVRKFLDFLESEKYTVYRYSIVLLVPILFHITDMIFFWTKKSVKFLCANSSEMCSKSTPSWIATVPFCVSLFFTLRATYMILCVVGADLRSFFANLCCKKNLASTDQKQEASTDQKYEGVSQEDAIWLENLHKKHGPYLKFHVKPQHMLDWQKKLYDDYMTTWKEPLSTLNTFNSNL